MTVPRDRRPSPARTRKRCVAASLVLALFIATSAAAAPSSTPSPTWGTDWYVHAVALSGTSAYVGGEFDRVAPSTGGFARVDPVQGALAPGSPPVLGSVLAAVPDGAGGWYLGGLFSMVGGVRRTNLAHVLSDGTVDPDWAPTTNDLVRALARVGGVVYAGGRFSQVNGGTGRNLIAGFDADTGAVTDFAPALSGQGLFDPGVFDIAIVSGGLAGPIVVAGGAFSVSSAAISNLAAFRTTGELLNFAPNPDGRVVALAQRSGQLSATIYVAGQFVKAGGQARSGLASFENFANTPTSWNPTFWPTPSALEREGSTIYVGGEREVRGFSADAPGAATGFAVEVPDSYQKEVAAITAMAGNVYVGGEFSETAPGDGRGRAAAFDAQTGALEGWGPAPSGGPMYALESDGTSVVLGGSFTTVGGALRRSLAQIDLLTGRATDFAAHGLPKRTVTAAAAHGSTLYVAVVASPNRVFALDAATGSRLGFEAGFNGAVRAIAVSGSTVFVGGNFTLANGVPRNRVASFQAAPGTAGALLPANPNFDGPVTALVLRRGTLYAGGDFTKVNGSVPRRGLAALDPVSGTATAFDAGLDGPANALALDGSTLYVGGGFAHAAGTVERDRAAAFDTATGSLTAFAPDLDGAVTTLAVADSTVFAAGPSGAFNWPFLALLDSASGDATGVEHIPSYRVEAIASSPEAGVVMGGWFTSLDGVPAVASHFAAFATAPGAPPQPVATAGEGSATVDFEPAPSGGAPITSYTVTASPGGQTATGAGSRITVPGLVNGTTYTFTVSATNRVGTGQASAASNAVTPGAPSAVQPPGGSGVPHGGSRVPAEATDVAPRIRGLRVTNRRWALARGRTPRVAAARRGTTFIFTLSEDARTSIRIERVVAGRRSGRRCVKPRPGLRRRCTRFVAAITLTRANTRSGVNRVRFTGRVGRRKLAPGRYRATVVATDGAGNRSAPRSVRFTVVR